MEKNKSKFLSLILRHKPETINIILDKNGYADVQELIGKVELTFDELKNIVDTNDKKRFEFNSDFTKIRARQGHSLTDVDVELKEMVPPEFLYHGTADRFLDKIMNDGLLKMNRQHVHLSDNLATAKNVGSRHGKVSIITIDTKKMYQDGFKFFKSNNGVWLTNNVPTKYFLI